jgi:hypothetical protein
MTAIGQFKNAMKKAVGNAGAVVYTAPSGAAYLIECDIACTGDSGVQISVSLVDSSAPQSEQEVFLVKNAPVPTGSSIQVIDGQKVVLESGDSIKVVCETSGQTVDVVLSLVENVNL